MKKAAELERRFAKKDGAAADGAAADGAAASTDSDSDQDDEDKITETEEAGEIRICTCNTFANAYLCRTANVYVCQAGLLVSSDNADITSKNVIYKSWHQAAGHHGIMHHPSWNRCC